jgi:hypothetical protein
MNVYQSALALREQYDGVQGFYNEFYRTIEANTYLIHHDALHYCLSLPPQEEYEAIVLSIEMMLGGITPTLGVDPEVLHEAISLLEEGVYEDFISFYTSHYNYN